jgi:sugar/nucleoside kinase (ribokinase family)
VEKSFDVVVVGNAGVDTNVYIHGQDIDFTVESNFAENIDTVGQAGGYASRGYASLGVRTAFVGYVGDDYSGQMVRDTLDGDQIDTRALFIDPTGTGRSVNIMYQDGRRKNFYDGKNHMNLTPDIELCRPVITGAKLAHFSIPNWARRLLPAVEELGLLIACDLQDVTSVNDPYRQDFIEYADILFFSASNFQDPAPLIDDFLNANSEQIVVVGMGAKGCALGTQEGIRKFPPVALAAPVIDTNGAGDSLAVGFLSSYVLDGRSLDESIWRGQIAARHACTLRGTSSGLITRHQLDEYQYDLERLGGLR